MSKTGKKYKSFKEYYADPEYKEKHLKYVKTKIICGCGSETRRCNISVHRASKKHIAWVNKNNDIKNIYLSRIEILTTKIEKINQEVHKISKQLKLIKI